MNERIKIQALGPYIGAQVSDVDLTRPLSDAQFEQLYHALIRHQVLFLRDQPLTRSSIASWRHGLATCIFTRFIRMRRMWRRLSCWIPMTITRRITTTGIPM
ncbi:hypothetical protein ERHA55_04270 [Erwinia rhapontici]|nr:hypothetical protein ERHA55_04270 [Erwinia rhapontici]